MLSPICVALLVSFDVANVISVLLVLPCPALVKDACVFFEKMGHYRFHDSFKAAAKYCQ